MLSPIRQFFIFLQLGMGGITSAMSGLRNEHQQIREWRSRIENYKYQGTLTDRQNMMGDFHRISIDMRKAFNRAVKKVNGIEK